MGNKTSFDLERWDEERASADQIDAGTAQVLPEETKAQLRERVVIDAIDVEGGEL